MTRTMYDSTNPGAIPTTAAIVAGYVDGLYAWKPGDWARFPNAIKVGIAVFESTNAGIVGDSEYLDMTPAGLVRWVRMRRAAGVDPTGYCSEGSFTRNGVEYGWAACKAAFAAAKVPEPHWLVAAYPGGGPAIPAGAIGHQWADPNTSGGDYDLSAVADYWPGVDQGGNVSGPVDLTSAATNAVWMQPCQVIWPKGSPNALAAVTQGAVANADGSVTEVHPAAAWLTVMAGREALSQPELAALQAGLSALQVSTAQVDADVKAGIAELAAQLTALQGTAAGLVADVAALKPATLAGTATVTVNLTPAGGTS